MILNKSNYFKVLGVCKIVDGISRSIIIDTQNFNYFVVPKDLIILLRKFDGKRICNVLDYYDLDNYNTVISYFIFLIKHHLIIQID